jgi:CDP-glucose 4,6-dehydratase
MVTIHSSLSNLLSKRIFLTGNTGFKGTWLSHLLTKASIESLGYSIAPAGSGRLVYDPGLVIPTKLGSILDLPVLLQTMKDFSPQVVIHFAAQSLVQKSYKFPRDTFEVNVIGTYNVLESALKTKSVETVLIITSDKVYSPNDLTHYFSEDASLGGKDPYSASKAAAEMVTEIIKAINNQQNLGINIFTGRAGNVIGGGDQSENRLLPDIVKSLITGSNIELRNPTQIRPWQHVLESISGYMRYINFSYQNSNLPSALNFGPNEQDHLSVEKVAKLACEYWNSSNSKIVNVSTNLPRENKQIFLNSDLAKKTLNWHPKWDTNQAIRLTLDWWKKYKYLKNQNEVYELYDNDMNLFFI